MERILERTYSGAGYWPMALHAQTSALGISQYKVQSSLLVYISEVSRTEYPEYDKFTGWKFCTFKGVSSNPSGAQDRLEA